MKAASKGESNINILLRMECFWCFRRGNWVQLCIQSTLFKLKLYIGNHIVRQIIFVVIFSTVLWGQGTEWQCCLSNTVTQTVMFATAFEPRTFEQR